MSKTQACEVPIAELAAAVPEILVAKWIDVEYSSHSAPVGKYIHHLLRALAAERERADRNQEDAERISWLQLYATMAESDNPDEEKSADEIGDSLRETFIANGGDLRAAIDSVRRK